MNYFQQHGDVFLRNIYQTAKGAIRLAVLQRDLAFLREQAPLRILDLGGGGGQMALWYATLGHEVVLIDMAADLIEQARTAANMHHLADKMTFIEGDFFQDCPDGDFDFIACHAVLEWTENGGDLLRLCREKMKKSAYLSLLYYNRDALEFAQHVFGNFHYLDRGLRPKRKQAKLTPHFPRSPQEIEALYRSQDFELKEESLVRCFYDYMKTADRERHSVAEIVQRELALSRDKRFLSCARYVHALLQRSADEQSK